MSFVELWGWRLTKFVRPLAIVAIVVQFFMAFLHLIVGEWTHAAWYGAKALFIAVVAAFAITVGTLTFKPKPIQKSQESQRS